MGRDTIQQSTVNRTEPGLESTHSMSITLRSFRKVSLLPTYFLVPTLHMPAGVPNLPGGLPVPPGRNLSTLFTGSFQ